MRVGGGRRGDEGSEGRSARLVGEDSPGGVGFGDGEGGVGSVVGVDLEEPFRAVIAVGGGAGRERGALGEVVEVELVGLGLGAGLREAVLGRRRRVSFESPSESSLTPSASQLTWPVALFFWHPASR